MNWLETHLDTTPAGIEPVSALLSSLGIDSLVIEDEQDFQNFLENNKQYWDYVDDDLLAQKHEYRLLHRASFQRMSLCHDLRHAKQRFRPICRV